MENITFFREILLPPLLEGTIATIKLAGLYIPTALIIGILIAVGRVYGNKLISSFCAIYILFFRGTPLLVQLFILYTGFPYIGIFLSPYEAVFIGFSLCSGAYQSEYIRGAIQSVKSGQMMAAKALGMTKSIAILYIILPQALRRAIPSCSNEIIYSIKGSSLAMMITYVELTGAGKIIASRYFNYTEVFLIIAVIYLLIISVVTKFLNSLERRTKISGFEMRK